MEVETLKLDNILENLRDLRLWAGLPGVLRLDVRAGGTWLMYLVLGHVYSTPIVIDAFASVSACCNEIRRWAVAKHGEAIRANRILHDEHARRCVDFWGADSRALAP
jgi:hypothetical protein